MTASVFLHLLQVFITQQYPGPRPAPLSTVDTTMGYEAVKFYRPMFHYLHPAPHTCAWDLIWSLEEVCHTAYSLSSSLLLYRGIFMNKNSFIAVFCVGNSKQRGRCTMCNSAKHHFIFHLMLFHKIQFGVFDVIGYFAATLISLQPGFSSIISPIKHIGRVHHLGGGRNNNHNLF